MHTGRRIAGNGNAGGLCGMREIKYGTGTI